MRNLFTALLIVLYTAAQGQGIKFEDSVSFTELKERAKADHKFVFVDAFTTWCVPCKEMSAEVFPDQVLGDYINSRFISTKVQMDQTNKDNNFVRAWYDDAKLIERDYKVTAYPTILLLSADGGLISRIVGYQKAGDLMATAQKSISEYEAFNQLYLEFKSGKVDTAFLKALVIHGKQIGQDHKAHEVAQAFINGLSEKDLFLKPNLIYAIQNTTLPSDRLYILAKERPRDIDKVLGVEGAAQAKVSRVIALNVIEPHMTDPKADWTLVEKEIKKKYGKLFDMQYYHGLRLIYGSDYKRWDDFAKFYALYFKNTKNPLGLHINNVTWDVVEHVDKPEFLNIAIKTMAYNNEKFDKNDAEAMDTYANLLYKAGRNNEAIAAEEKALKLEEANAAKFNGKPNPVFKETLEKMKRGEKLW